MNHVNDGKIIHFNLQTFAITMTFLLGRYNHRPNCSNEIRSNGFPVLDTTKERQ